MVGYGSRLEMQLGHTPQFDALETSFRRYLEGEELSTYPRTLRRVKEFLKHRTDERNEIFRGTLLRESDCTTLAILASSLAERVGFPVEVVRPTTTHRIFHMAIGYAETGNRQVFKIAGKKPDKTYATLNPAQVCASLRLFKPIIDLINREVLHKY